MFNIVIVLYIYQYSERNNLYIKMKRKKIYAFILWR